MVRELNFKPYLICVFAISTLACIFSYKISIGLLIGTGYFFVSDSLNQIKFPKLNNSKGIAIGKVFLISFVQLIILIGIAVLTYFVFGLPTFLATFVGITIPHIYFIIVELRKLKK